MEEVVQYIQGDNPLLIGRDSIEFLESTLESSRIFYPKNAIDRKSIDKLQKLIKDLQVRIKNFFDKYDSVFLIPVGQVPNMDDILKLKKDFEQVEQMMVMVHDYCNKLGL